jgi:hypothetical protein
MLDATTRVLLCRYSSTNALLPMLTATLLGLWKLLAVFLVVVAVVDLLTMSQARKIHRLHRLGLSQQSIADRLRISRYQVRKALAV